MAKNVSVKITTLSGGSWFVDPKVFTSFGVTENPVAVINSWIRGSRLPLLKVFENADLTGKNTYLNVDFIMYVDVDYNKE